MDEGDAIPFLLAGGEITVHISKTGNGFQRSRPRCLLVAHGKSCGDLFIPRSCAPDLCYLAPPRHQLMSAEPLLEHIELARYFMEDNCQPQDDLELTPYEWNNPQILNRILLAGGEFDVVTLNRSMPLSRAVLALSDRYRRIDLHMCRSAEDHYPMYFLQLPGIQLEPDVYRSFGRTKGGKPSTLR